MACRNYERSVYFRENSEIFKGTFVGTIVEIPKQFLNTLNPY
jgi:hypothetical protein